MRREGNFQPKKLPIGWMKRKHTCKKAGIKEAKRPQLRLERDCNTKSMKTSWLIMCETTRPAAVYNQSRCETSPAESEYTA